MINYESKLALRSAHLDYTHTYSTCMYTDVFLAYKCIPYREEVMMDLCKLLKTDRHATEYNFRLKTVQANKHQLY